MKAIDYWRHKRLHGECEETFTIQYAFSKPIEIKNLVQLTSDGSEMIAIISVEDKEFGTYEKELRFLIDNIENLSIFLSFHSHITEISLTNKCTRVIIKE